MLEITIPASESYDESVQEFVSVAETTIRLEHSLVSISKWESKWEKPFLSKDEKTTEEVADYIRCMSDDDIPPEIIPRISQDSLTNINEYIAAKMSATWITEKPSVGKSQEILTAEIFYYWMIALNIPFECQYWHLNRLFMLIKVCNEKNQPPKKMSQSELAARNQRINAARKAKHKTKG